MFTRGYISALFFTMISPCPHISISSQAGTRQPKRGSLRPPRYQRAHHAPGKPWMPWDEALDAMENGPFIDGLPTKNGDFPWLC